MHATLLQRLPHSAFQTGYINPTPHKVCCATEEQVQTDVMAVGYGRHEFGTVGGGVVGLWSLKSPTWPLWSWSTPAGVTTLAWSSITGNLLAVGLHDGTLAVYNATARKVLSSLMPGQGLLMRVKTVHNVHKRGSPGNYSCPCYTAARRA